MTRRCGIWLALLASALVCQEPPAEKQPDPIELAARLPTDPHAATRLLHLGNKGVPALRSYLTGKLSWPEPQKAARHTSLLLLRDLAADGAAAIDDLVLCLDQPDWVPLRVELFTAIGAIGPYLERRAAISLAIGSRCGKGHYFGEECFFRMISRLSFDATQDQLQLQNGLEHQNSWVRELAAEALARSLQATPANAARKNALLLALRTAFEADLPQTFQLTWTWDGNQANSGGSTDNHSQLLQALGLAIATLEPMAPESAFGQLRNLDHSDPVIRIEALRALGGLGATAAVAIPAMIKALQSDNVQVAREAATSLGLLGPLAKDARAALLEACKGTDKSHAARANAALRQSQQ